MEELSALVLCHDDTRIVHFNVDWSKSSWRSSLLPATFLPFSSFMQKVWVVFVIQHSTVQEKFESILSFILNVNWHRTIATLLIKYFKEEACCVPCALIPNATQRAVRMALLPLPLFPVMKFCAVPIAAQWSSCHGTWSFPVLSSWLTLLSPQFLPCCKKRSNAWHHAKQSR